MKNLTDDQLISYAVAYKNMMNKSKRLEATKMYGLDVKSAYHVVRLLNEVEMIMTEGDLDIERNREQLKSIRRGEWTYEQICDYFNKKEKELETLYQSSTLRHSPDEQQIRNLLLDCLEMRFGNLSGVVERPDKADATIKQIVSILKTQRYI